MVHCYKGYVTGARGTGGEGNEREGGEDGEVDVSTRQTGVLHARVCGGTYPVTLVSAPSPSPFSSMFFSISSCSSMVVWSLLPLYFSRTSLRFIAPLRL